MDHVLIVDDSPTVRAQMGRWLKDLGFDVSEAASGGEAFEKIRAIPPDLLILDLGLPDMDGLEVCRRLRKDETTARIPVVVLTSSESQEDRVRSLDMGAEDFLTKPPTLPEMRARIQTLLRSKHLSDRLLLSYLEMDRLGSFAESFLYRPITGWTRPEVADAMADHVLGIGTEDPHRPGLIWASFPADDELVGILWRRIGEISETHPTSCPRRELLELMRPADRGDGQYVSKRPMPGPMAELLGLDPKAPPSNYVAVDVNGNVILAADYPWEAGIYELPLLRAMHRHWTVFERLREDAQRVEEAFFQTMEALAVAAEFYDSGTGLHIRRVGYLSGRLAGLAGKKPEFVKWIVQAAKVHDVGKITIPFKILAKPSRLSPEEMEIMRRHTLNGAQVLAGSRHLEMARCIAQSHHENFDGSGYPDGLLGREIPLEARIVRLMDVYDALRSKRRYKRAYSHQESLRVLLEGDERIQRSHFDQDLLQLLVDHGEEISDLYDLLGDSVPPLEVVAGTRAFGEF